MRAKNSGKDTEGLYNGINIKKAWELIKARDAFVKNSQGAGAKTYVLPEGIDLSDSAKAALRKLAKAITSMYNKDNAIFSKRNDILRALAEAYSAEFFIEDTVGREQFAGMLNFFDRFERSSKTFNFGNEEETYQYIIYRTLEEYTGTLEAKLRKNDISEQTQKAALKAVTEFRTLYPGKEMATDSPEFNNIFQKHMKQEAAAAKKRDLSLAEEDKVITYRRQETKQDPNDPDTYYDISLTVTDVTENKIPLILGYLGELSDDDMIEIREALEETYTKIDEGLYTNKLVAQASKSEVEPIEAGEFGTEQAFYEKLREVSEDDYMMIKILRNASKTGVLRVPTSIISSQELSDLEAGKIEHLSLFKSELGKDSRKYLKAIRARKKYLKEEFSSSYEMWNLLSTPILNDDAGFMEYVGDQLSQAHPKFLRELGIDTPGKQEMLMNERNVQNLAQSLLLNKAQMYAFIHTIEALRTIYMRTELSKRNLKPSWTKAHEVFVVNRNAENIRTVKDHKRFTQGRRSEVFGMNVYADVENETKAVFGALGYVRQQNKLLRSVVDLEARDVSSSLENRVVVNTENKIVTIARTIQNDSYGSLFKYSNTGFKGTNVTLKYRYLMADAVIDMMAERNAKDVNSVGSGNVLYQTIREKFTAVFKLIEDTNFKDKDFIRVFDISIALNDLLAVPSMVKFYSTQLDKYVAGSFNANSPEANKINKALTDLTDFFRRQDSLVDFDLDNTLAKAVLAKIMQEKHNLLFETHESYVFKIRQYARKQAEAANKSKVNQILGIANHLKAATNKQAILDVLTEATGEISKEDEELVDRILKVHQYIKNKEDINDRAQYDTIEHSNEVTNILGQEEYLSSAKVKRTETELKATSGKLSGQRKSRTATYNNHFKEIPGSDPVKQAKEYAAEAQVEMNQAEGNRHTAEAQRDWLLAKDKQVIEDFIIEIVYNHPELLMQQIESISKAVDDLDNQIEKKQKHIDGYPKEFLDELVRRRKLINATPKGPERFALIDALKEEKYTLNGKEVKFLDTRYLKAEEELNKLIEARDFKLLHIEVIENHVSGNELIADRDLLSYGKRFLEDLKTQYALVSKERYEAFFK